MESFGHIKDNAHSSNIRKIEAILPEDVKKNWSMIVIDEMLEDSSLMLRYEKPIEFFSKEKTSVKYLVRTCPQAQGGSEVVKTVTTIDSGV